MSDHDPFAALKGVSSEPVVKPVSSTSGGGSRPVSTNVDTDIPDPHFTIMDMETATRPTSIGSLGQGVSIIGATLVQSWREEKARRNK